MVAKENKILARTLLLNEAHCSHGYQLPKLVSTLKKFYEWHHDLADTYNVAVSMSISDVLP